MNARDRLIVALDVPKAEAARALVDRLAGHVGMFKVGSQLFTAAGPDLVHEIVGRREKVFLDLKFHDIPNTVAGAVGTASRLGVSFIDVHGLGGRAMMEAGVGALPAMGTRLLAITILTSHDEETLDEIGVNGSMAESVRRLAQLAKEAGADGVVASPHEVAMVREACGSDFLIVTPGIRPAGAARGDQARAATPAAALAAGADYLVVGRPITEAADPVAAADGVAARAWSPRAAPAGRMPGVTIRKSLPQASRTRATSCGETTTPSVPASFASWARRRTDSAIEPFTPISPRLPSSWLVRMVIARRRVPMAGSAPTAASIIARPPRPWTSTSETPRRVALDTAPATVFGMS